MSEYDIEYTGRDENGHYYELENKAPFTGVTVNELDGTVTFHE